MRKRIGTRVRIVGGVAEFEGKTGVIIGVEEPSKHFPVLYRVKLDVPVTVPGVGQVLDDLWEGRFLANVKKGAYREMVTNREKLVLIEACVAPAVHAEWHTTPPTSENSHGNEDDVFNDGVTFGEHLMAAGVLAILRGDLTWRSYMAILRGEPSR